jgi:metal-sulfur cluster biosynthetic enzyme
MKSERSLVLEALQTIEDPELGADIISLGLLYNVQKTNGEWRITMTLTYPGCPLSDYFHERVSESIHKRLENAKVKLTFSFDPPWKPDMMDPDLRAAYNLG